MSATTVAKILDCCNLLILLLFRYLFKKFYIFSLSRTESTSSANNSITSPVQDISCPVCMDDKKQVQVEIFSLTTGNC